MICKRILLITLSKELDLPFTLDPYLMIMSVKQVGIKFLFFLVFGMTPPGIEPRSAGPLANSLVIMPMAR